MAGKSKEAKKKRAKMKKHVVEEQRHNDKKTVKKIVATQAGDEVNNNLEPTPPKVNEDAQKGGLPIDAEGNLHVTVGEERYKIPTDKSKLEEPFDPKSVVANILKKKDGA